MDKQTFIAACRDGGPAIEVALRQLDRSYFAVLHRECRRMIRDADQARELVHVAFIKVWQRCATFQGDSELLPWIRTIVRRVTLDRLRAPARETSVDWQASDELATSDDADRVVAVPVAPEAAMHDAQSAECFARCWENFVQHCPQHATVIAWIAEDGLSNEDIAELLDRTPGATREYIRQCRIRARHYLAEWYELTFGGDA